jgi:hypothetical protein
MRTWIALIFLALVSNACASKVVRVEPDPPVRVPANERGDFVSDFRVSHYLELAVALQALVPQERANRLQDMARARSYEVFPLCRMLFEAKDGDVFRRPMLGGAEFITGTYADWPLEPITLSDGIPFLVVRGYMIAGLPESPGQYLAYCLAHCQWTQRKYIAATSAEIGQALERLMSANSGLRVHADWLRLQTR